VNDFSSIAVNYLKHGFVFDFISSVPVIVAKFYYRHNHNDFYGVSDSPNFSTFHNLYYMKMFCIFHLNKVFSDMTILEEILKGKWLHYKFVLENLFSLQKIWLFFFTCIHLMTCIWTMLNLKGAGLYIEALEKGDLKKNDLTVIDISEFWGIYITSIYFVTTTMTTVGYGDIVPTTGNEDKNT